VSRHWKPEIVTPDWTRASAYRRGSAGKLVLVLASAAAVGLAAAFVLSPRVDDTNGKPDAPIEWNAVQAVPKRALTPDEIAWEKRGTDKPSPSWGGLGGGAASAQGDDATAKVSSAADAAGPPPTSPTRGEANLYIIDGDTISIGGQRIRIANIDAPETHPSRCPEEARLGLAATQKLRELLRSGSVTMSGTGHDQYGRELRYVQVDGQDVGETMIAAGLARSYSGGKKQGWC